MVKSWSDIGQTVVKQGSNSIGVQTAVKQGSNSGQMAVKQRWSSGRLAMSAAAAAGRDVSRHSHCFGGRGPGCRTAGAHSSERSARVALAGKQARCAAADLVK